MGDADKDVQKEYHEQGRQGLVMAIQDCTERYPYPFHYAPSSLPCLATWFFGWDQSPYLGL